MKIRLKKKKQLLNNYQNKTNNQIRKILINLNFYLKKSDFLKNGSFNESMSKVQIEKKLENLFGW